MMDYIPYDCENFRYEENDDEVTHVAKGCFRSIIFIIVTIVLLCVTLCLVGCKSTEYIEVPVVHTDTLIQTKVQRDSIWKHDSIFVNQWQAGDTIFQVKDRWHTKYVESIKHDTVYVSKRDSVTVATPSQQTKPSLTWWQEARLHLANIMLWLALLAFVIWLGKKKLRL
jgi:hypothetical protein